MSMSRHDMSDAHKDKTKKKKTQSPPQPRSPQTYAPPPHRRVDLLNIGVLVILPATLPKTPQINILKDFGRELSKHTRLT